MPHIVSPSNKTALSSLKNKIIFIQNSPFSWWLSEGQAKLPPEVESDNVEYKVNKSSLMDYLILFYL